MTTVICPILSCFISIIHCFFFFVFYKTLMSVKLVKGHLSVLSLLYICVFVVALSSFLLFLNWRVLSFESTCDFHIFFSRLVAWFSCVVYMQKRGREREKDCVCMSTVVYLHNCACSFLCAMCSYSFYRWKKMRKKEEKKRCKKTYRIFVSFLVLFSFFF
jgi:hypothetical protein